MPLAASAFSYVEFSFHHIDIDNQNESLCQWLRLQDGVVEYDFYEPWTFHYFTHFEPVAMTLCGSIHRPLSHRDESRAVEAVSAQSE